MGLDLAAGSLSTSTPPSPPVILTVTLHEGTGFSAADQYKDLFNSYEHDYGPIGRPNYGRRFHLPYALLDYEMSQVSVECFLGTTENPRWRPTFDRCKFDVSRAAELTIYLYLRDPEACMGSQDVFLGVVRLDPLEQTTFPGPQWLEVQNGTGRIRISLEYTHVGNRTLEMDEFKSVMGSERLSISGHVFQAKKKDTKRLYAEKSVWTAGLSPQSEVAPRINHPFIAPLTFGVQSTEVLHLFTPLVTGGHLFSHIQRVQRFDIDRSRFYAAEILCALEYLHDSHNIHGWLKPRNVLLDSLGHVTLCGFGLFGLQTRREHRTTHSTPEYPAPELLLDKDNESRTADWWTLGIFLYEMLTGLPLFYDEDTEKIRRKILDQPIRLPESILPSAADILIRLLDRRPKQRLGARGASEVKAHAFFQDVDWQKLLQRGYEPIFKPGHFTGPFRQHGVNDPPQRRLTLQEQFAGFLDNQPIFTKPEGKTETNNTLPSGTPPLESPQASVEEDDDWELVWEEASRKFYFSNRLTNAVETVNARDVDPLAPAVEGAVPDYTVSNTPRLSQKQDALEAALKGGHDHAISQLLEYGMDLNFQVSGTKRTTPLQWATEQENLGLVRLFLAKGADANSPPALIKAVEKGNQELVKALVQKTDRVSSTRALGLAVDRRDTAVVNVLLAEGVRCDFEQSDRPHPRHPLDNGCYFHDVSEAKEYIPPLVRAVKHGKIELARSLLAHGADANVGYHDLSREVCEFTPEEEPIRFRCGRVVQLATELGHLEMVRLLLDRGADISLAQPVWPVLGHECRLVPRAVYQKVAAGLRAAVAAAVAEAKEAS